MSNPESIVLAVSMGDPAGIGPELIALARAALIQERDAGRDARAEAHTNARPVLALFADPALLAERARAVGAPLVLREVANARAAARLPPGEIAVVAVPLAEPSHAGRPSPANAGAVIAAIEQATQAVANGDADALVTLPIAKEVLYAAGFRHPGHTEMLAELAARWWPALGGQVPHPVMMLASQDLRVVPVTVHVALAEVPRRLTRALVAETIRITAAALARDFALPRPRIAVAGLNPHAGEGGSMGREEIEVIAPAIVELAAEGLAVTGPHSADTLFHAEARQRYDAVVAMYHDQALIPLKTLAFDEGVNVTLGLPFVRTSPDHGTAFDIAGKGVARPQSFLAAIGLAAELERRRRASGVGQ
jgi:4-hydroxythreonine-4-phosphate dehydrogenase